MRSSSTRDPSIHQCQLCYRYHSLRFCRRFLEMDSTERNKTARRYNYCVNCFARTHNVYSCDSPDTCMYCGQLHHTLLHPNRRPRAAITRRSVHDRLGHRQQSSRGTRRYRESTASRKQPKQQQPKPHQQRPEAFDSPHHPSTYQQSSQAYHQKQQQCSSSQNSGNNPQPTYPIRSYPFFGSSSLCNISQQLVAQVQRGAPCPN